MKKMTFNLIGAGRLGRTLAYAFTQEAKAELRAIYNRQINASQDVAHQLRTGTAIQSLSELKPADMLWLTVTDDQITSVVASLAAATVLKPHTVVVHCSGVLSANILKPLAQQGCDIASFHPLKSFTGELTPRVFRDCYCAIEGSPVAVKTLSALFKPLGAKLLLIEPEKKALYHTAAVMSSNYLVALAAASRQLFQEAGFAELDAEAISHQLMCSSLNALETTENLSLALSGPLSRGDTQTIEKHLAALQNSDLKTLYCTLGLAALPCTKLDKKLMATLKNLLEK